MKRIAKSESPARNKYSNQLVTASLSPTRKRANSNEQEIAHNRSPVKISKTEAKTEAKTEDSGLVTPKSSPSKIQKTPLTPQTPSTLLAHDLAKIEVKSPNKRFELGEDEPITISALLNHIADLQKKLSPPKKPSSSSPSRSPLTKNVKTKLRNNKKTLLKQLAELIAAKINYLDTQTSLEDFYKNSLKLNAEQFNKLLALEVFKELPEYNFYRKLRYTSKLAGSINTELETMKKLFGNGNKELEEALLQVQLENELKSFDIKHIGLSDLSVHITQPTRIILTCGRECIRGFGKMHEFLNLKKNKNRNESKIQILESSTIEDILTSTNSNNIHRTEFEIAWGHISNDAKRKYKNETVVFATSITGLKLALQNCSLDSTLVIDGHGGADRMTICDERNVTKNHIDQIAPLLNEKITHTVLSTCTSGLLTQQQANKALVKYNDTSNSNFLYKNRQKLYIKSPEELPFMFDKLEYSADNENDCLASQFASAVLFRPTQNKNLGSAFTFSPSLVFPDQLKGLIGAPLCNDGARTDWPDYIKDWNNDSRLKNNQKHIKQIKYKTITMFNSYKNKKSTVIGGEGNPVWSRKKLLP